MPMPVYGAETYDFQTWKLNSANAAGVRWLRQSAFDWDLIEPVRYDNPVYDWSQVDEAGLIQASSRNLTVIGTIKFTPSWAQKIPGEYCGPIAPNSMDEFARFVSALVARYSIPPYNIRYWEFGNEVDVDPDLLPDPRNGYGCWGDESDPYYGGRYYADMLKWAYPAVKAASSSSQVLIGGLLLDCDPTHPPAGKTCKPAKFLEGILINGGAGSFDIVSFHSYIGFGKFGSDSTLKIRDEDNPSFAYRGGQIIGKIDFIKSVLSAYQVSKPIFMTEVSLSCKEEEVFCTTEQALFWDLQADFVVSSNLRSWGEGLIGTIWYTLEESYWRGTGLHINTGAPKPGYYALQFMSTELKDATVKAKISDYPGLRGYKFELTTKNVWVLWTPDGVYRRYHPAPARYERDF